MTEIQNPKQKNNRFAYGPEGTGLEFETCPLVPCNGRRVYLRFDA